MATSDKYRHYLFGYLASIAVMASSFSVRKQFLKAKPAKKKHAEPKPEMTGPKPEKAFVDRINNLAENWKARLGPWRNNLKNTRPLLIASDCSGYGSDVIALRLLGLHREVRSVMTCEKDTVSSQRPQVVVLEQVSSILEQRFSKVWHFILKILRKLNYSVDYKVMNTKNYGLPQSRPRVYVVAVAAETVRQQVNLPTARSDTIDLHTCLDKSKIGSEVLNLPHYYSAPWCYNLCYNQLILELFIYP